MCSIAVRTCIIMHAYEHSEGHARQSFHVFGTRLFKYGGGEEEAFKKNKKGLVACKKGEDLLDVRSGGVVVEIMQMRRSVKQSWSRLSKGIFGTKITKSFYLKLIHGRRSECQDALGASALLIPG